MTVGECIINEDDWTVTEWHEDGRAITYPITNQDDCFGLECVPRHADVIVAGKGDRWLTIPVENLRRRH